MAATPSTMPGLGIIASPFELPDTSGVPVTLDDFEGSRALLVMFICNHCPYVRHLRQDFARLGREYLPQGVAIVAINSNDAELYPADGPAEMAKERVEAGWDFPYLYDEEQEVAKAYRAACTPDFFLFDSERRLVYRGQYDDSRPGNGVPVTGRDLRAAIDAILAGEPIPEGQRPSIGCNIKWKPGSAPSYFG